MPSYREQEVVMQTSKELIADAWLTPQQVSKKAISIEPDCQQSKWFDYRFMSPRSATRRFARDYEEAFRDKWLHIYDRSEADKKNPLNGLQEAPSGLWTSLWVARQTADLVGMPYNIFIERLFENHQSQGGQKLPRPNQLFGEKAVERIKRFIIPEWQSLCLAMPRFSRLSAYRNAAFVGTSEQIAHHDHLIAYLKSREGNIKHVVESWCYTEQILTVSRAQAEFPALGVEEPAATKSKVFEPTEAMPGCFGLPHASGASDVCGNCPYSTGCLKVSTGLMKRLRDRLGVDDPVDEIRRSRVRERVRRHRAVEPKHSLVAADAP